MTMRIFNPLPADHPMVTGGTRCAQCHEPFEAGDRTTLIPVDPTGRGGTVQALPAHAPLHRGAGGEITPGRVNMTGEEFVDAIATLQADNELTDGQVASALIGIVVVLCERTGNDPVSLVHWAMDEARGGPSRAPPMGPRQ